MSYPARSSEMIRRIRLSQAKGRFPADSDAQLQALIQSLYGNGEAGAFYIPRPVILGKQVLFQDSAGAVPVVSDGDPVGLMKDVSGGGNDASQVNSSARPVYRTDGSYHWLDFDGVDDYLIASNVNIVQSFAHVALYDPSASGAVYGVDSSINRYSLFHTSSRVYLYDNGGTTATQTFAEYSSSGNPATWSARHDGSESGSYIRQSGVLTATGSTDPVTGNLYVGRRDNLTGILNGGFYGGGVISAQVDDETVSQTENYLSGLSGD